MKNFFAILMSILLMILVTLCIPIFSEETNLSLEDGEKAIQLIVKQENFRYDDKHDWYVSDKFVDPFVFKYEKYRSDLYKVIFYRKSLSAKPSCYSMVNIKTGQIQGQFSMDEDYEAFLSRLQKGKMNEEIRKQMQANSPPTDNNRLQIYNSKNSVDYITNDKIKLSLEGKIPKEILYLKNEQLKMDDTNNNPTRLTLKIKDSEELYENFWNDGLHIRVVDFDTTDNRLDILITANGTDVGCTSTIYQYDGVKLVKYDSFEHVGSQLLYDGKGNIYFCSGGDMIVDEHYFYKSRRFGDIKDRDFIKQLSWLVR